MRALLASLAMAIALFPRLALAQPPPTPDAAPVPVPVPVPVPDPDPDPDPAPDPAPDLLPPDPPAPERRIRGGIHGDYHLRSNAMSPIPLTPVPGDDAGTFDELGQELWVAQWVRLRAELDLWGTLRFVGETDLFEGVVFGEYARGVDAARQPRSETQSFVGIDPRALYLEWHTTAGTLVAGLMTTHVGMGALTNDGAHEPFFGDYRFGDVVTRLRFDLAPFGSDSPFRVAAFGDLVVTDPRAVLADGDLAVHGGLTGYYDDGDRSAGLYAFYRAERRTDDAGPTPIDVGRDLVAIDAFARWDADEPSGGRIALSGELAAWLGRSTADRTFTDDASAVRQLLFALRVAREGGPVVVAIDAGWASGDARPDDGVDSAAAMHPDHRMGLVLFPELIAWETARSATLLSSGIGLARPPPGTERIATNGAITGAAYVFPTVSIRPVEAIDIRIGGLWARATADIVDRWYWYAYGAARSFRSGDPRARDLGLELDASLRVKAPLPLGVTLGGALEGGILFPGHAFDDATGASMGPVGLLRVRLDLGF